MSRNVRPAPMRIDTKYFGAQTSLVTRLTRLFDGKEFCVMNGEEGTPKKNKLSKNEIEVILCKHGGKIVQNPGNETFAIIVGNPKSVSSIYSHFELILFFRCPGRKKIITLVRVLGKSEKCCENRKMGRRIVELVEAGHR